MAIIAMCIPILAGKKEKWQAMMDQLTNDIFISEDNILGKLRKLDSLDGKEYEKLYDEIIQVGEFENN